MWELWGEAQRTWLCEISGSKALTKLDRPISDDKFLNLEALDLEAEDDTAELLFFLHPPPIGTFLSAPPLVQ